MGAISALDRAFSHTGMCRFAGFAAVLLCLSLISPPVVAKSPKAKTKISASKAPRDAAPLIPQSAWNALMNTWVEVLVRDGRTVRGRLVGVDESIATIVEQSGQVVALELPNALNLRQVEAPPAPPEPLPASPMTSSSADVEIPSDATVPQVWNAISIYDTARYGLTSYVPRSGGGLRYSRRLSGAHWIQFTLGSYLDYGDWRNFQLDGCGLGSSVDSCGKGVVAGVDVRAAWVYGHVPRRRPKLTVSGRLGVGAGWWQLPTISGSRQQSRESSWIFGVIPGMGFRYAPSRVFALGFDAGIVVGLSRSRETGLARPTETITEFLLALELDPLVLVFRF